MKKKRNYKKIAGRMSIVVLIGVFLYLVSYEIYYSHGEHMGKYSSLIYDQCFLNRNLNLTGPDYILPDQYPFYGRYVFTDETDEDGIAILTVVNDRKVNIEVFEYKGKLYYYYVSDKQKTPNTHKYYDFFVLIYPDIYNADKDTISFSLWENPESLFIQDNYLYYVYGKNFYNVRRIDLQSLYILHRNEKDYHYARLNLDTGENEKISKEQYEKEYTTEFLKIFRHLPSLTT